LVALIKIADYATVIPGVALFMLGGLVFLLAGMQASFDAHEIWDRIAWEAAHIDHAAADLTPEASA
jgi:paraquat-inducible protein A